MKIALLTFEFYPIYGGITHTTSNLFNKLLQYGHEVLLFNPYSSGKNIFRNIEVNKYNINNFFSDFKKIKFLTFLFKSFLLILRDKRLKISERSKIIIYLILKSKLYIQAFKNTFNLLTFFKKERFEILFCTGTGGIGLIMSYLLSRFFNVKTISLSHGNDFLIESNISIKSILIKKLDMIILNTKRMKDFIQKIHHIEEKKLFVINRGLNLAELEVPEKKKEIKSLLDIPSDQINLLSVGRIIQRKNFELVIKAMKKIILRNPKLNIKYFIIGTGPFENSLKRLTQNLKIESFIEFLGPLDDNLRNKYFKIADIFLMPSISLKNSIEGFGIVFIEANYFKIPVIGSDTGGIREAIIHEETGLLIKSNNIDDLIDKITYLINNKEKAKIMGINGYKRVINEFNWDIIIKEYVDVLNKLMNRN